MSSARFLAWFVSCALGLFLSVAVVNIVVDPYLVFGLPRTKGFNAAKPAAGESERLMKAYDAPRHPAATLVLGSSRSGVGLDPGDPAWPDALGQVYNLSLAGSKAREHLRYLRHVVQLQQEVKPKTVVIGLDFEYFLAPPERAAIPMSQRELSLRVDDERLAVLDDGRPNPTRLMRIAQDYAEVTLSLDALMSSVSTMFANRRAEGVDLEPNGHLSESRFRAALVYDTVSRLFDENNRLFIRNYANKGLVLDRQETADAVGAMMAFAKANGMKVIFFVQPFHVDRLESFERAGYGPAFEDWKRQLVTLVTAGRDAGQDVTLWDFAGYDRYASETVPAPDDHRTRLRWFWEPGHYTTALGSKMIGSMLGTGSGPAYGVELGPGNIEARIAEVRADRVLYLEQALEATRRLNRLFCGSPDCPLSAQ